MPDSWLERMETALDSLTQAAEHGSLPIGISDEQLTALRQIVSTTYAEEVAKLNFEASTEEEQSEILRGFVEQLSLQTGLMCLMLTARDDVNLDVELPAEKLTNILTQLIRRGSATIRLSADD